MTRDVIDDAQRAERVPGSGNQGGTGVKADFWSAGDQGIGAKARVLDGIRNDQDIGAAYGMRTKCHVAWRLRDLKADFGLEPLTITVDKADQADRRADDRSRQARELIEHLFRRRIENVIRLQREQSLSFFSGNRARICLEAGYR